jgi:hypothetical protein
MSYIRIWMKRKLVQTASMIIESPGKVIDPLFTEDEKDIMQEDDLSLESLKDKYNLEVDGKPATKEEIEKMIKHIKLYRLMKQNESS